MKEDLRIWKRRAKDAEAKVEILKAMLHRMGVSEDRIEGVLKRGEVPK